MKSSAGLTRWVLLSLAVLAAVGVFIRLGFWQLDRLDQRRNFNARVLANQSMPLLDLTANPDAAGLETMEYRSAAVRGEYLFDAQLMLRNQVEVGLPGVHLLTPLKISGRDQAVLVDRGWIPLEDASPARWGKYDEPGPVEVLGVLRNPQAGLRTSRLDVVDGKLIAMNVVDLPALENQMSLHLLPVYIHQEPAEVSSTLLVRSRTVLELDEGSHAGYALQWFSFAALLAVGYPYFVYSHLRRQAGRGLKLSHQDTAGYNLITHRSRVKHENKP